jgi:hypothetical protein
MIVSNLVSLEYASLILGTVLASVGLHNTCAEVDVLANTLDAIAWASIRKVTSLTSERGEDTRSDVKDQFEKCFFP